MLNVIAITFVAKHVALNVCVPLRTLGAAQQAYWRPLPSLLSNHQDLLTPLTVGTRLKVTMQDPLITIAFH